MKKLLLLSALAIAFTYTSNSYARPAGGSCLPFEDGESVENVFDVNNCGVRSNTVYWNIGSRSYSILKVKYTRIDNETRIKTQTFCERIGRVFQIRQIETEQFRVCEPDDGGGRYQYR